MSQSALLEQPQTGPQQPDLPQPRENGPHRLGPAKAVAAALVDILTMTVPPILTHVLLEWTVLAWIIAGQILGLLTLLLATVGRTPGLALVSAVVTAVPKGTPGVGQALVRVILTPLLPLRRRVAGSEDAPDSALAARRPVSTVKTTLLDPLTRTSTTTSRAGRRSTTRVDSPQASMTSPTAPGISAPAPIGEANLSPVMPAAPASGVQGYSSGVAPAPTSAVPAAPASAVPPAPTSAAPAAPTSGVQGYSSGVVPAPAPPQAESAQLPRSFPPAGPGASTTPPPAAVPIPAPTPGAPVTAPLPTTANSPIDGTAGTGPSRPSAPPLYRIVIDSTRRLPLEGQCILGREPRALSPEDVQLVTLNTSTAVSRSHLRIGVAGAGPWAEDLGSANGSALLLPDGTKTPLAPGVRTPLGIGGAVLLADGIHVAIEASRRARRAQQSA